MFFFFFFNDTATTEIYTLSLHDALPICFPLQISTPAPGLPVQLGAWRFSAAIVSLHQEGDRKSTRLNSSHSQISYAVFCLKKKKKKEIIKLISNVNMKNENIKYAVCNV